MNIRKGDTVQVISGNDKGKRGKVLSADPAAGRCTLAILLPHAQPRAACERRAPGKVIFRPLGRIVVKGRSEAVPIHEVFAEAGSVMPLLASDAYHRGHWKDRAKRGWAKLFAA